MPQTDEVKVGWVVCFKVFQPLLRTFWWTFGEVLRVWPGGATIKCTDKARPPDWPEKYDVRLPDHVDLDVGHLRALQRATRDWATGERVEYPPIKR